MEKPNLSIIIVTWNTALITLRCIKKIQKFLSSDLPEIIVVDNASTDNTQALLKKIKNIVVVKNDQNYGFSKACNQGAKKAASDYLLFLNSDMEIVDDSLLAMLKYLKENKDIGAIGPQFLNPDLSVQPSVFPPQTPLNAIKEYWLGLKDSFSKTYPGTSYPSKVWAISGGAIMISSRLFQSIQGWDEKYFFYYEDLDLCQKLRKLGKFIVYFPKCKVIHYHGASGKNITDPQNQWKRLIPSSKIYHGPFGHYLIFIIIWISQQWKKLFS